MAINGIPDDLISKTLTFDYKTRITKVISELKNYPAVVVSKDGSYYGMIDSRAIYRTKQNMTLGKEENLGKFVMRVPRITNSTSVDDLVYYFYKSRTKALPYYNGKRISGVLERKTLLKMLLSLGALKEIKVREAMTTPILAIDTGANISQARSAMRNNKVNRLAVLDGEKLVGLVTNYDIVQRYTKVEDRLPMNSKSYNPSNVSVSDVMERNPRLIDHERALSEAVRQLVENNISSILVVKGSKPVGMLTVMDVLESVIAKRRIEDRKVFISGLDAESYQYSDDIREELKSFIEHAERLSGIRIDYVTFRVKRVGNKSYEIQVRLSLGNKGIISLHTTTPSFSESFRDILDRLKERLMKEKERMLTVRKVNLYRDAEAVS